MSNLQQNIWIMEHFYSMCYLKFVTYLSSNKFLFQIDRFTLTHRLARTVFIDVYKVLKSAISTLLCFAGASLPATCILMLQT